MASAVTPISGGSASTATDARTESTNLINAREMLRGALKDLEKQERKARSTWLNTRVADLASKGVVVAADIAATYAAMQTALTQIVTQLAAVKALLEVVDDRLDQLSKDYGEAVLPALKKMRDEFLRARDTAESEEKRAEVPIKRLNLEIAKLEARLGKQAPTKTHRSRKPRKKRKAKP